MPSPDNSFDAETSDLSPNQFTAVGKDAARSAILPAVVFNDEHVEQYKNGDVETSHVDNQVQGWHVLVKTFSGKTITLDVEASDTIQSTFVEILIQFRQCQGQDPGQEGISPDQQQLRFDHRQNHHP